jgi:hypothetical protein
VEKRVPIDEKRAHHALQEYTALRFENATTAEERFASEFVLKPLKTRLGSESPINSIDK